MTFEFQANTHPGRTRENNEDSVVFDSALQIGVLADGMGGYNAGEVASGMATDLILGALCKDLAGANGSGEGAQLHNAIEDAVLKANTSIYEAARNNQQYSGMGTTLVMGVFKPERIVIGHVGDSRCYRLRDRSLALLTRDHSLLQEQLDAGLITPLQAANSGNRNLVTRALGVEDAVLLDLREHAVMPADLFLLCSDGLNDMVTDDEITAILNRKESLSRKADALIEAANAHGGRDNVSVLLVQAPGRRARRGLMARLLNH